MKGPSHHNKYFWLLLTLVCLEILSQTYGFLWGNKALASVIYFLAGLGVALVPMIQWKIYNHKKSPLYHYSAWGILGVLLIWCLGSTELLLNSAPLNYQQADMLPIIQTMTQRLWNNQMVYAPIAEIWEGMQPIYLPAMWLPYIIAIPAKIDIRWVGASLLLISAVLAFLAPVKKDRWQVGQLWAMLPLVLLCIYIFGIYSTLITLSEEPVVVFYYVLLGFALYRQWPVLIGVAIALCLLSRYSLVFWVPVFLTFQFYYQSRRAAGRSFLALIAMCGLLLTIGQAWAQIWFFLGLQDNYLQDLLAEESRWKFVAQLANNPGLVKFLPYEHIALWHQSLIWGSLVLPILSLLAFKQWHQKLDKRFFGLCSLKLSLVYFYNMLTIPYSYLFYPSAFLSLLILFSVFAAKKEVSV